MCANTNIDYDKDRFFQIRDLLISDFNQQNLFSELAELMELNGRKDIAGTLRHQVLPKWILQEWGVPEAATMHLAVHEKNIVYPSKKNKSLNPAIATTKQHPNFFPRDVEIEGFFSYFQDVDVVGNGRNFVAQLGDQVLRDYSIGNVDFLAYASSPSNEVLNGTSVALIGLTQAPNYWHWMVDVLPRLLMLKRGGVLMSEIDHFILPPLRYQYQWDSLGMLGIDKSRVVELNKSIKFRLEKAFLPSYIFSSGQSNHIRVPAWAKDELRKFFLPHAKVDVESYERVFVSRKTTGSRSFTREDEIIEFLEAYNYHPVIFENLSFKQQLGILRNTKMLIAPHGAGLTNLLWLDKRASILEFFTDTYVNPCYWMLSSQMGAAYHYYCSSRSKSKGIDPTTQKESISCDMKDFERVVNKYSFI